MDDRERRNQISVSVAFVIFASGLLVGLADSDSPLRPIGLPGVPNYVVAAAGLLAFGWVCLRRRPPSP